MKTQVKTTRILLSSLLSGIAMWVTGGLWHNLVLPAVDEKMHPHHEGLFITLLAYFLLAFFISWIYKNFSDDRDTLWKGMKSGMMVGVLWVFPHGLTMAAVHESSFSYQFTNTLYHIVEQGIGGVVVYAVFSYKRKKGINA